MVSFVCDVCNDVMTKPKVRNHRYMSTRFHAYNTFRCRGASFHCLDCNVCFTQQTVQNHSTCITEAEKWHGKFANQRGKYIFTNILTCKGAGSLNQRTKKNNNQQNQNNKNNNNQNAEKPAEPKVEEKKDEKPDKNSKRKRTSDASESDKHKKKKTKVEAPTEEAKPVNFVINSDELKWKRKISKALKKADNKTMDKNDLKKKVVDALLKDLRTQFETSFDAQVSCGLPII